MDYNNRYGYYKRTKLWKFDYDMFKDLINFWNEGKLDENLSYGECLERIAKKYGFNNRRVLKGISRAMDRELERPELPIAIWNKGQKML